MLEETDHALPATDAPTPDARSISASERGYQAAVFILVAVALVLVSILVLDSTNRFRDISSTSATPAGDSLNTSDNLSPATPAPAAQFDAAATGQGADGLASRIQSDASALADLVGEMQALLTQKQEELNSTVTLYTTATRQVEQLGDQLKQAMGDAADAKRFRTELANALAMLDTAERRAKALELQLTDAPDKDTFMALQSSLDEADKMRVASSREAAELKSRLAGLVSSDLLAAANKEIAALQERLAGMTPENDKLRYEIQRLRTELNRTRLFIDKVDDLPAAAKMLFVELAKLETAKPGELLAEYERIEKDLNADVVDTISFATGSSQIDLKKVEEIRRSIRASGTDSYFLVVGYASKTGDLQTNKKLSADRATTIASVADANKDDGQGVNAVFLGQTDRFSPTEVLSNQVCEIWEIRKTP